MKRLIVLSACILLCASAAEAQYEVSSSERQTIIVDSQGDQLISITPNRQGEVRMKIAGYEILFGDDGSNSRRRISKFGNVYDGDAAFFEIGYSALTTPDYSLYTAADGDFMALGSKSTHVALNWLTTSVSISPHGILRLATGFSSVWDNYVFANKITLDSQSGKVVPAAVPSGTAKSKLTTSACRIPLMLELNFSDKLCLSAGVYGEYVTGHTKYKYPNTKSYTVNGCLSSLRWGYTAHLRLSDWIAVYCDYGCTPLFQNGKGPVTYPVSFGFGFIF